MFCARCPGRQCLLSALFQLHRERLKQLVISRLAGRFKHRFDASDVTQEAFVRVTDPPGVSSLELAERLLDSITSPSQAANRSERILQVRRALEHTRA